MTLLYEEFLDRKAQLGSQDGFAPTYLPDWLYDFQRLLVDWAVRRGRAAIFADCGLGKTPMQLVWAQNVVEHTNRPVLILTPLAVSAQTIGEAARFGIPCHNALDGDLRPGINVANYERLHYFASSDVAGVVCDESSILKNFDGERKAAITAFMRKLPYRLLCTATAAPNDYIELGTSSEALGELGYMDMLSRYFKNDQNTNNPNRNFAGAQWRFKGHAEEPFWRWVASWARALRRPSDLGCDDAAFVLPDLREREHVVDTASPPDGMLFALPAVGLKEQRDELRRTIAERCDRVVALLDDDYWVSWCHLNAEGDRLAALLPDAVQVSGDDSLEVKEERLIAFTRGQVRRLIIKPKIGAWGLNWQHCAKMTMFPSHSFEQYYQAVRRCWRFGQRRPVQVEVISTEGYQNVLANLRRKAAGADRMFSSLVTHMHQALTVARSHEFTTRTEVPTWLSVSNT
jgi:hypothetical protein